jgi:hypothetical protein
VKKKYAPQIPQIFADLIEKKICENLCKSVVKKYAPQITQIFADLMEKKICGNLWKSVVKKCTTDSSD